MILKILSAGILLALLVFGFIWYRGQVALRFDSVANDSAQITFSLYKSGEFTLSFKDLEAPETSALRGEWSEEGAEIEFIVTDAGPLKPSGLDDFFSVPENQSLRKVKDSTYRFKSSATSLFLWGILCERAN